MKMTKKKKKKKKRGRRAEESEIWGEFPLVPRVFRVDVT